MPGGVNENQGAESTLSFLLSLMAIIEGYTIAEKTDPLLKTINKEEIEKGDDVKSIPINPLSVGKILKKNSVEEMKQK
jgi:hypothetical protein